MNWSALLSAFGLVFVAELGDKTQLAVITQTCKFRRPWPVFCGASLALTAVTALGAVGGSVVGMFIPAIVIRLAAAAAFVVMGLLIWREAAQSHSAACATDIECVDNADRTAKLNWQAFGTTFTLLFFAELGDKTQLAVLGLSSKQAAGPVFAGGALALIVVTALGVLGGQQLTRWIPEKLLLKISAAAFVVMGILMGLGVL
ncbi:MAG TPA: TMEM165/GDT1 family protein [Anaerolineae bacterium]|nr:TMEM165/GDT1 family protein [Anaerolineae bacterium]HQH38842.1 TMEM165/GDT1 family protein [Anaerolineae bacterium]